MDGIGKRRTLSVRHLAERDGQLVPAVDHRDGRRQVHLLLLRELGVEAGMDVGVRAVLEQMGWPTKRHSFRTARREAQAKGWRCLRCANHRHGQQACEDRKVASSV